jgi:exopolysaccharide biosynthesis predicted pyruvyltransferase EpsI
MTTPAHGPPAPLLPLSAVVPIFTPLIGKRVALVHSPHTGNAGDRLIEHSAEQLLTRFGIAFAVREPDEPGDADVILLFGGGNFGHVNCPLEADRRARALATGKPCVLLPQTAYGSESRHDYATAFVRDVPSLAHVLGAVLAPDLALCYQPERTLPAPTVAVGEFFIRGYEGYQRDRGTDPRYDFTDGRDYLDFVATHARLFTDSLHVAICGLIARREVTLYPTALHKQRGAWEAWLRNLGCAWGG